jgi:hypothetical protein
MVTRSPFPELSFRIAERDQCGTITGTCLGREPDQEEEGRGRHTSRSIGRRRRVLSVRTGKADGGELTRGLDGQRGGPTRSGGAGGRSSLGALHDKGEGRVSA